MSTWPSIFSDIKPDISDIFVHIISVFNRTIGCRNEISEIQQQNIRRENVVFRNPRNSINEFIYFYRFFIWCSKIIWPRTSGGLILFHLTKP